MPNYSKSKPKSNSQTLAIVKAVKSAMASNNKPQRKRITGRGAYKEGDYTRTAGSLAGTALGTFLGGPVGGGIGAMAGGALGHLIHKLTGSGAYATNASKIKKNSILISSPNDGIPDMHGDGMGSIRVRHREYLGNVLGSKLFVNNPYVINPTNLNTFPWLSQIAQNFEQWKPYGIAFEFRTMSSDTQIGSTVSLGSVLLATEYNVLAARFVNPQEMLNSQWSDSMKPSLSCMHFIECDKSMTPNLPLYCRDPSDVGMSDSRLYDLANFQLATEGMTSSGDGEIIGQLWISYDIGLLKPVLADTSFTIPYDFKYQSQFTGDVLGASLFGSTPSAWVKGTYGGLQTAINTPTNTVSFPANMPESVDNIFCKYQINFNTPLSAPVSAIVPNSFINCVLVASEYGLADIQSASDVENYITDFTINIIDKTQPASYTLTGAADAVIKGSFDLYHTVINPRTAL